MPYFEDYLRKGLLGKIINFLDSGIIGGNIFDYSLLNNIKQVKTLLYISFTKNELKMILNKIKQERKYYILNNIMMTNSLFDFNIKLIADYLHRWRSRYWNNYFGMSKFLDGLIEKIQKNRERITKYVLVSLYKKLPLYLVDVIKGYLC